MAKWHLCWQMTFTVLHTQTHDLKKKQRESGFGTTEGRVLLSTGTLLQLADCVCVVNGVDACPVVDCVRGSEGEGMFGVRVRLCACGTDVAPLCNTCTPGIHVPQPGGEH